MFLELLLSLVAILIVADYLKKRRINNIYKQAGITGPGYTLPVIGNALQVIGNDTTNVFPLLKGFNDRFGKIWHIWFVDQNMCFVRDAKYFEGILSSQQLISKNIFYDQLKVWLGDGLLISTGRKWHGRRKIITPAFHFKILEQFVEIFDQQSSIMIKKLSKQADGKTVVNMFPVVCLTALDIIAESAMGVKIDAQLHPEFPYARAVTDVADILATRFMKVEWRYDLGFKIIAPLTVRKLMKSIDIMHKFTDKVIEERRRILERSIADGTYRNLNTELNDIGLKTRLAFLDVLLQATIDGKPLSNQDIREEVDTFMFEGHDTTTSGISHTLYLIARHPVVQQKLFAEICSVIGDNKHAAVGMHQLQELKYLECVIKESLRLFPPVPMIGRYTETDIEINGKIFPAKTSFALLIYAALRDPDYFENPDDFIPERFSTENVADVDAFSYVPFSAGPRNCIGQKFALLEMKSTISKVLRHYELLPLGEPVRPMMNLILRSSTGINVGLQPRVYN